MAKKQTPGCDKTHWGSPSDGTTGANVSTIKESYVSVTVGDLTDNLSDILSTEISGGVASIIDLDGSSGVGVTVL